MSLSDDLREAKGLDAKDIEVLRRAATSRTDTFRPWRGAFGRSSRLCREGYLKNAGSSVMPPYVTYVITDAGRRAIAAAETTK